MSEMLSQLADYLDRLEEQMLAADTDMLVDEETPPSLWADRLRAQLSAPADGKQAGEAVAWREVEMMRLIDFLRSQEGDEVTICCDNPDFNGQPNCAVICNGDWTGWEDRRFAADTVLDALSMAATEYQLSVPRDVIAESNGHHWVRRFHLTCCRDCGIVRRADDMNSPCKGVVHVGPRASPQAAVDQAGQDYFNAIDRSLVVRHLGVAAGNPLEELDAILSWEVSVALDPRVSSAAQALIDSGGAQAGKMIEALEKIAYAPPGGVGPTLRESIEIARAALSAQSAVSSEIYK